MRCVRMCASLFFRRLSHTVIIDSRLHVLFFGKQRTHSGLSQRRTHRLELNVLLRSFPLTVRIIRLPPANLDTTSCSFFFNPEMVTLEQNNFEFRRITCKELERIVCQRVALVRQSDTSSMTNMNSFGVALRTSESPVGLRTESFGVGGIPILTNICVCSFNNRAWRGAKRRWLVVLDLCRICVV